eukprot:200464-Pelagomonas_calceolata.AAC.1
MNGLLWAERFHMIASMFASWCYQGRISDETINLLTPHYGPFDTDFGCLPIRLAFVKERKGKERKGKGCIAVPACGGQLS